MAMNGQGNQDVGPTQFVPGGEEAVGTHVTINLGNLERHIGNRINTAIEPYARKEDVENLVRDFLGELVAQEVVQRLGEFKQSILDQMDGRISTVVTGFNTSLHTTQNELTLLKNDAVKKEAFTDFEAQLQRDIEDLKGTLRTCNARVDALVRRKTRLEASIKTLGELLLELDASVQRGLDSHKARLGEFLGTLGDPVGLGPFKGAGKGALVGPQGVPPLPGPHAPFPIA